jgi:phytoene dehydrogenase-like protein
MSADDAVIRAPIVISDAGVSATFGQLVPREVAESAGLVADLARVAPSMAHLCLYLGFEQTAEELALPTHNIWVYPTDDVDAAFRASLDDPSAEFPVLYVSFPGAKDPDFDRRHPGRATVEVIAPAPFAWFEPWAGSRWKHRAAEYEAFKESLAERMLEGLYAQVPQLRGQVAFQEISTPLSTAHFAGYARGELYGLEHTPARFQQGFLKPATPIPGLYLTGQDVVTCGVAGAMLGGVLTATALLRGPLMARLAASAARRALPARLRPGRGAPQRADEPVTAPAR